MQIVTITKYVEQLSCRFFLRLDNLFPRFLDFSQFLTAIIYATIVAPPNNDNENYVPVVDPKVQSLLKQACAAEMAVRYAALTCVSL